MHDVSNAINRLDTSGAVDKGICKKNFVSGSDTADTCRVGSNPTSTGGLSKWFDDAQNTEWNTIGKKAEKWYEHNAKVVAKDISGNLNREEKGVVSSAFAKAHEGAEIVEIRSISTTSVMVNACYDVLTDGLLVHISFGIAYPNLIMDAASVNNTRQSKIYITDIYLKHKKNMHDVSNAINILDPSNTIDAKICKTGSDSATNLSDAESGLTGGKCPSKSSLSASSGMGLEKLTSAENSITGFADTDKMSVLPKTSAQIVKDVSDLPRDQKGVVSSAF